MTTKGESLVQPCLSELGNGTNTAQLLQFLARAAGNPNLPLPNMFVVDGSYTGSGHDGSWSAPFLTIGAAMAAIAADNTTVIVMPGTYTENVVVPPTRNGIAIVGLSRANTTITSTGPAASAVTFTPTSTAALSFEMSELTVTSASAGGTGIKISGFFSGANTPALSNLVLSNVTVVVDPAVVAAVVISSLNGATVTGCNFIGNETLFSNVSRATINGCFFSALNVSFDSDAGVVPVSGRGTISVGGGTNVAGTFTIAAQAQVVFDASTSVGSVAHSGLSVNAANTLAPSFTFRGVQGTAAVPGTFVLQLPTAAALASLVDISESKLYAASVSIIAGAAGTQLVRAIGLRIMAAAGVVALTGPGVIGLDVRGMAGGANVPYTVAGGTHTVDRSKIVLPATAIAGAATALTFNAGILAGQPPFPTGATYSVTFGQNVAVAATDIPFTTLHTPTTFTLTSANAGTTADIVITRAGTLS